MFIFTHAITSISVFPKSENYSRRVYSRKKRIGWDWRSIIPIYETKYYVYNWWSDEKISTVEEYNSIAKKSYVEDNIVYHKPHCRIFMNDKTNQDVFFETEGELYAYVENLTSMAPHIKI
jgi:hypothetical protein